VYREFQRLRKGTTAVYFKEILRHSPGRKEGLRPRFESGIVTFQIQIDSVTRVPDSLVYYILVYVNSALRGQQSVI
jgi:hypothetical protein